MKKLFFIALFAALAMPQGVQADLIVTTTADSRVRGDNGSRIAGSANPAEVGGHGSSFISAFVMPFELPTLAEGQSFNNATLSFNLFDIGAGVVAGEADLYGLNRVGSNHNVAAGDFFAGPTDAANTLLQDGILDASSTTGFAVQTDASGSSALSNFLNTQYAGGANAGQFVFLRLNFDAATAAGNERFRIVTFNGDAATAGTINFDPVAIPEPSSLALLGLGGLAMVIRRKRK